VQNDVEQTYVGDFPVIQSTRLLLHPFDVRYDFTLVCDQCYVQTARGHSGYIRLGRLPHDCRRYVLLVRTKNDPIAQWAKIRQRNLKVSACNINAFENPSVYLLCIFVRQLIMKIENKL